MSKTNNPVTFFELPADNMERISTFYQSVFGWKTPEQGGGNLWAFTTETDDYGQSTQVGAVNGDFRRRGPGLEQPLIMITVDDVEAKLKVVEEAGGAVIHPAQDESAFGGPVWAVFADTEGNKLGIYSFKH